MKTWELGLTDLETRRKREDLLQIYKIKKGFELVDLDIRENEGVSEGISRRHNSQITREKQGGTMRDKFLLNRTATTWNFLPSEYQRLIRSISLKPKLTDT